MLRCLVTVSSTCWGGGDNTSSLPRNITSTFDAMVFPKTYDTQGSPSVSVGIVQPQEIGTRYCGGLIGKGNKVCTETPEACSISSHTTNRINLDKDFLFIGNSKIFDESHWVYQSLKLAISKIPSSKLDDVLKETLNFEAWCIFFSTVENLGDNDGNKEEVFADLQQKTKACDLSYYTPHAKRVRIKEDLSIDSFSSETILKLTITPQIQHFMEGMFTNLTDDEHKAIQRMWDEICSTFINVKNDFDMVETRRKRDHDDAFKNDSLLEDRLGALAAIIGSQSGIQAKLGLPSLWHGVLKAMEKVEKLPNNTQSFESLQKKIHDLEFFLTQKLHDHERSLAVLSQNSGPNTIFENKLNELENSLENVLVPTYENRFTDLTTWMVAAEQTLSTRAVPQMGSPVSSFLSTLQQANTSRNTPTSIPIDIGTRVSKLEKATTLLEARMGNEVVHIGGMVFKSQSDVKALIVKEFPSYSWSYFYDVVSFLERLSHTYTSWDKEMEHQHRATQVVSILEKRGK